MTVSIVGVICQVVLSGQGHIDWEKPTKQIDQGGFILSRLNRFANRATEASRE